MTVRLGMSAVPLAQRAVMVKATLAAPSERLAGEADRTMPVVGCSCPWLPRATSNTTDATRRTATAPGTAARRRVVRPAVLECNSYFYLEPRSICYTVRLPDSWYCGGGRRRASAAGRNRGWLHGCRRRRGCRENARPSSLRPHHGVRNRLCRTPADHLGRAQGQDPPPVRQKARCFLTAWRGCSKRRGGLSSLKGSSRRQSIRKRRRTAPARLLTVLGAGA